MLPGRRVIRLRSVPRPAPTMLAEFPGGVKTHSRRNTLKVTSLMEALPRLAQERRNSDDDPESFGNSPGRVPPSDRSPGPPPTGRGRRHDRGVPGVCRWTVAREGFRPGQGQPKGRGPATGPQRSSGLGRGPAVEPTRRNDRPRGRRAARSNAGTVSIAEAARGAGMVEVDPVPRSRQWLPIDGHESIVGESRLTLHSAG
jgi:hypothetical protein